ncbi:ABC transporter substrate-binding protein [Actinomadura madurae]|uniref:ABC transporter substrate-binding protein n=1 Tax=Actinomadura madurae TaxID=1993 RepID=UPI002025C258|nr:ABC transporter substrate-binding protein [Actinomadura madurae]MCP9955203.1 ABC transporter substrate-binding protein [Actinomadura madurae]MCP9971940.1 ABC transporter substrate-binding protein [Actinomadura madurae]MCQ0020635.1 ABC transporter substrate-binding protein [Actinomadura madurae]URN02827.1 ABC transporter substrate-binding protein [Actinomadura madurae]
MRPVRTLGAVMAIGAVMFASACGGDDATSGDGTTSAEQSVTVQAGNGAVTVPARPKRIVSLSPTHTETLFAIGAGPQVVAVDEYSNHPANAPKTKLSGFKPNAEAIIAYKPDLVVLSDDLNGVVKALEKVKVPVLLEPAATKLDDAYDEITDLGQATGHTAEAKKVTDDMRASIQRTVAASSKAKGLTYYHELDQQLHSVTSQTFVGQVYGLFGLQNIADKAGKASGGYPQLSREYLLKQDPDLIFLADTKCCGQNAAALAERPGWSDLEAVKGEGVVELDDDIASRWGPRLPEFVKAIGDAAQKVQ